MKNGLLSRTAFTLVELLLAAAAAALILSVVVNVYGNAIRLRRSADEHTRESRLVARAVSLLRNDLRGARLSGGALAQILDTGSGAVSSRYPGDLHFNTTSGRIDEDNFSSDLLEVEYYIGDDVKGGDATSGILKRAITHSLPGATPEIEKEENILSGVEQMTVEFFDGTDWQTSWEVDTTDPVVPMAIRVRITLHAEAHPSSVRQTLEVLVPWTTQVATPSATSASSPAAGNSVTGGGTSP